MAEQTPNEPTKPSLSESQIKPTQNPTLNPENKHPFNKLSQRIRSLNPFKPKMSEEELQEFVEKGEIYLQESQIQSQITDKLESWIASIKPGIEKRANGLGIDKNDIDNFSQELMFSFWQEMHDIRDPEKLAELKIKADLDAQGIQDEILKSQLETSINSTTSLSLLSLIDKKFSNQELTKIEQLLLDTFLVARQGAPNTGEYHYLGNKIIIPVLGANNLSAYNATLHHEFTHFAFDTLIPEGFDVRLHKMLDEENGEVNPEKKKTQALFLSLMTAINEACAHRAAKYFEGTDPYFEGYRHKVAPRIFKSAYKTVDEIAQGKTLEEFDQAAIQLYKNFVGQWSENLTMPQLHDAVKRTFSEEAPRLQTVVKI